MLASSDEKTVILGFNIKIESKARDQVERFNINPQIFDIIYKLVEEFDKIVEDRLPFEEKETVLGKLKILKTFSSQKDTHVVGGRVEEGRLQKGNLVKIIRREQELGHGRITELQSQKIKTNEVLEGNECGLQIESKFEMIPGDIIQAIVIEKLKI